MSTYFLAPTQWLAGDLRATIPGSISGTEFNDQFTGAVQKIYDSGEKNPVAFAHAGSIMVWTMLNVQNPKDSLMGTHPLPNMGRVVIKGNPVTGWRLVDWDGIENFSS
jgi:broad specificity phosphatase PhoE